MANIFIWNFKFCKIIIVLTCWISQSDGQCSQDINGVYRFGSECGFLCHCLKDEQCDVSTGDCPSGCGFEWVGPGCQHKNIALDGYQRHLDNIQPHRYSVLANDRDLSTCSHTGGENTIRIVNPFWRIWRPFNFTLRQMEILTLDNKRRYFDGFTVIVEYVPGANKEDNNYNPALSQICYTHTNTSLESVSLTVTCEHAYSGNQVKIQLGRRNTQLVLCDVRIYGDCAENVCTYDCNKLCFCKNVTANDKVSGTCSNGCTGRWSGKDGACDRVCETGKWGVNCTNVCGMCLTGTCNHTDGICMEGNRCKAGYTSYPWCNQECEDWLYGLKCQSYCSQNCKNNVPCRKTDGQCPDGCARGYIGNECTENCPVGYHGYDCEEKCSAHCAGEHVDCDKAYGTCLAGCNPGWTGRTCQEEEPAETTEAMTAVIAVVAGVGAAIIVVIILGIVAILWYLRRTRKSYENKHENRENHGMAMSNISSEDVKQTDKSGNTYEDLQGGNVDEHQYELSDPTHRF